MRVQGIFPRSDAPAGDAAGFREVNEAMPIYEYKCQGCEERLEAIQAMSAPPLTTCPECGGELKKLLSAPAFQFKGSGWYVTDYARKGNGSSKDGETKSDDKKSETKSDSGGTKDAKPAATGEKAAKSAAG